MKLLFLLLIILLQTSLIKAQSDKTAYKHYYSIAFTNSHSAKPFKSFSSLFYQEFHPGIEAGYGSYASSLIKHQWLWEVKFGYMYHRWVQHNISFQFQGGYRQMIGSSWAAEVKLGGGYQISIPDSKVYRITENDGLVREHLPLRSQFIGNLGFGISKDLKPPYGPRIFMEYQQRLQIPFVNAYVPILPYNNLLIGIEIPMR